VFFFEFLSLHPGYNQTDFCDTSYFSSTGAQNINIFSMGCIMASISDSSGYPVSIADLCNHIKANPSSSAAHMGDLIWYKELEGVQHEFLVIEVQDGKGGVLWVRLERAAKRNYSKGRSLLERLWMRSRSISSVFPANDSAIILSNWTGAPGTRIIQKIPLSQSATLGSLEKLLTTFCEVAVNYSLFEVDPANFQWFY